MSFEPQEPRSKESMTTCRTSDRELSETSSDVAADDESLKKRRCVCSFPLNLPTNPSKVAFTRILFLFCLVGVAVGLGFAINRLQSQSEQTLAKEQFEAIAERALNTSVAIAQRKRMGTITLASLASTLHPDPEEWPNVWINEFEALANNIIHTSDGRSMGLMPLVYQDTLANFEAFLYDDVIARKCPNDTAVHSFGKGVHGNDPGLNTSDNRYHETDGSTYWGSPYQVITPYLYHSYGCAILSFNLHSFELFGRVIDDVLQCFEAQKEQRANNNSAATTSCTTLSDALYLIGATPDRKSSPAAILMEAIYPSNDPSTLVGIISSTIEWSDVLVDVFSPEVSGIDAVLSTETQNFTYEIHRGVATVKGEGDLHDYTYNDEGRSMIFNENGGYSYSSATYSLTLYPTDTFYEVYSTQCRYLVPIGAVLLILLAALVFFIYDRFITQEVHEKKSVLEAKRQHVRFISHEVRTPLNAVGMGQQLLQDEMTSFTKILRMQKEILPSEAHQVVEDMEISLKEWSDLTAQVYSNTISATDVLNDLLNYDKIESGTLVLETELVQIEKLVRKTVMEFYLQARQKGVQMDFLEEKSLSKDVEAADSKQLKVVGDPVRLTQVMRNFISNGIKFTPAKGELRVKMTYRVDEAKTNKVKTYSLHDGQHIEATEQGWVEIVIQDTGAGLSKEQLASIFGKGVQFNANKLQRGQGSGLGLYIAKGMIEQHGGTLTVASQGLGKGTTFTIKLPLIQVLNEGTSMNESKRSAFLSRPRSFTSLENLKVLVVDDAEINRKLLCRLLENHGQSTDQAENGRVAVDKCKEGLRQNAPYHTILMDHEMPEMNGPEATRAIRRLEAKHADTNAYIIGVIGDMFPEDVQHFKDSGAEEVLGKPLRYDELKEAWLDLKYSGGIATSPNAPRSD